MRLGKYLSSLTKPELEELKEKCGFSDEELGIFEMKSHGFSNIEISDKMNTSLATINRRLQKIYDKIERYDKYMEKVPIWEKMNLTIDEAAAYSNIGLNKVAELARNPKCPFVLYVGKKKLIKRKEFEKFIAETLEV